MFTLCVCFIAVRHQKIVQFTEFHWNLRYGFCSQALSESMKDLLKEFQVNLTNYFRQCNIISNNKNLWLKELSLQDKSNSLSFCSDPNCSAWIQTPKCTIIITAIMVLSPTNSVSIGVAVGQFPLVIHVYQIVIFCPGASCWCCLL